MVQINVKRVVAVGGSVLLAALVVACAPDKKKPETSEPRANSVDSFIEAQAAEGAREDAMLNATHFTGPRLNTAGQTKINLMLRNQPPTEQLMVYLDLSKNDPLAAARRQSLQDFVKTSGFPIAQLQLKDGPNPATNHPAAAGLQQLRKTDSDYKSSGQNTDGTGSVGVTEGSTQKP